MIRPATLAMLSVAAVSALSTAHAQTAGGQPTTSPNSGQQNPAPPQAQQYTPYQYKPQDPAGGSQPYNQPSYQAPNPEYSPKQQFEKYPNYNPVPYKGSEQDQQACIGDVFRLCNQFIPDAPRIVACLQSNKPGLSPACRAVFSRGNPADKPTRPHRRKSAPAKH